MPEPRDLDYNCEVLLYKANEELDELKAQMKDHIESNICIDAIDNETDKTANTLVRLEHENCKLKAKIAELELSLGKEIQKGDG